MGNTSEVADRRQARRHRVALSVELEQRTGLTRDISTAGVFFETDSSVPVGATLRFSFVLEYADPEGPVRLRCQGEVVRVERRKGKVGVAVRFSSYRFDLAEQGCPSLEQAELFSDRADSRLSP